MSRHFDYTVGICTHNRSRLLSDTLASIQVAQIPDGVSVELLIIDNGSTDDTPMVSQQFAAGFDGRCEYVFERKLGLAHARNRLINEASGRIVIFLDDDVFVEPEWLSAFHNTFNVFPHAGCIGGRVSLKFESEEPAWLKAGPCWLNLTGFYSCFEPEGEDTILELSEALHPVGTNTAIRRSVFDKIGAFNPALGRVGGNLLSKEESEFFHRIAIANIPVAYSHEARVWHRVPPERTRFSWMARRLYWQGVSSIIYDRLIDKRTDASSTKGILEDAKNYLFLIFGRSISPKAIWWKVMSVRKWHLLFLFLIVGKTVGRFRNLSADIRH